MRITITIDTGNSAFEDYPTEVGRLLQDAARRLNSHLHYGPGSFKLWDTNGNPVGEVVISRDTERTNG